MKRDIIPYNPELKALARQLRQSMTRAEVLIWNALKQGQMRGHDFDRQRPMDEFIVDFYCKDLKLAIELDGITHTWETAPAYDATRQARLESLGVQFLRFTDDDVKSRMGWVLAEIEQWIVEHEVAGLQS